MSRTELSRRSFLGMTAALPFVVSNALKAQKKVPVGLELYSVRGDLAKDLLGTVAAVGKMGYQVVEFYAPYLTWTPETAKGVRKVLDDSGLKCPSTHNNGPSFTPEGLKKAIELNQIIGSTSLIMASAPRATVIDDWKKLGDQLTAIAAQLRPLGMATGYHNHQVEWRPLDGQRPMDVIAANTPKDVVLQFDVGTCLEVGADPIAWINAQPGADQEPALEGLGARARLRRPVRRRLRPVEDDLPGRGSGGWRGVLPDRAGDRREQHRRASHGAALSGELEEAARLTETHQRNGHAPGARRRSGARERVSESRGAKPLGQG